MRIAPPSFELTAPKADATRIDHVARQLEGQFAQLLVKSMRDASFGDALFPGENQMFRDMYDQQVAKALTDGRGLGLAPMIARQLSRQSGGREDGPPLDTRLDAGARAPLPMDAAGAAATSPAYEQALDLIAGREPGGGQASSPLDRLVERLMAPAAIAPVQDVSAASASSAATAAAAAEEFAPRSPERFVAGIWHHAQAAARELGVDAKALVAQAALETGWGRRQIQRGDGASANNLFGIKATGWKGERVTTGTHEYVGGTKVRETADFRAYASPAESFADYVRMLKNNPRYQKALQSGGDVGRFAQALQNAGYATDPSYAAKIAAIANGPTIGRAVAAIGAVAARAGTVAGQSVANAADALGTVSRR
ncbi:flagellar assembly peptidoglycan hydrolase FlgJ [Xanthomonas sp. XNM01]|uniref:flagellar assembly peptidoglycan hydrolase FlgJ n=1 Tax=Xanthomonas sp. XNM01 TaxID=2769289 RepID=UPI001786B598|nr:flagellar assembly peptidoglycan hydrolase FlgJ [Xanthomonas sp. XNM01]MBD9368315.1 flagellar assembly peptidoglycan hydrolase FlgJ [Xanthomonas sp. XNM01]